MMLGRQAGSGVGQYNAKSPKQDSKVFNSITKTIQFAHLGILFIYAEIKIIFGTVYIRRWIQSRAKPPPSSK